MGHPAQPHRPEVKAAVAPYASPALATIVADRAAHPAARSPEATEGIASFREKRKPSWYPQ